MKIIDSDYLHASLFCVCFATNTWIVTYPVWKLIEMAIKDDRFYVILEMLRKY